MFIFNASLNAVAPVSPIMFPVVFVNKRTDKQECVVDECLFV